MNAIPRDGPQLGLRLVNLTRHVVNLLTTGGDEIVLTPEQIAARCDVDRRPGGTVRTTDGAVALTFVGLGEVRDLPDPQAGTVYVVSGVVADAVPDRDDVAFPDDVVRDEQGRVIGARALGRSVPTVGPSTAPVHRV